MADFRVKDSFELTGRGGVLLGDLLSGTLRIGMNVVSVDTSALETAFTISAVEMVDHVGLKTHCIGLNFKGQPTKEQLDVLFPTGSLLRLEDEYRSR